MTATATPRHSARARGVEHTRQAIIRSARTVFVSQGYRTSSLRDIASAAGLSHPGVLRHFATKGELLIAVMAEIESETEALGADAHGGGAHGTLGYPTIARHNTEIPGYLALFAALTGEASTPSHPAHEWMRARYRRLRSLAASAFEDAASAGDFAADRDPAGEAVRVSAAWDGVQLLEQYLPERVDTVAALELHAEQVARPIGWRGDDPTTPAPTTPSAPPMPPADAQDVDTEVGYGVGRERRARIVADALALFAVDGYGDTSLREIAARVGVSKANLLHHYGSKEGLLRAVLVERDRKIRTRSSHSSGARAADILRDLPLGAAENQHASPGLIEAYAVLSCEAVPPGHPAHEYFAQRFGRSLDYFSALFRAAQADGDLPPHRDPEHEAIWLIGLWDGMQYQWLYDRDAVDIAAHLSAHLEDVLPRRLASAGPPRR